MKFATAARFLIPFLLVVPLAGVTGRHSLFLLFRNETAKAGDSLMSLASIRFVPAEPKP